MRESGAAWNHTVRDVGVHGITQSLGFTLGSMKNIYAVATNDFLGKVTMGGGERLLLGCINMHCFTLLFLLWSRHRKLIFETGYQIKEITVSMAFSPVYYGIVDNSSQETIS